MLNISPWSILFLAINLIVLYVIMRRVFIKPLKGIIEKREQIIRSGLENAAEKEKNAQALEQEWQEKMEGAKSKSAEMMAKAKSDADEEYQRLVADANAEARRIVADARKTMENEKSKAIEDLQSEIAGIALDAAAKVLENSDLKEINHSLYEKFLTETGDGNDSDGD